MARRAADVRRNSNSHFDRKGHDGHVRDDGCPQATSCSRAKDYLQTVASVALSAWVPLSCEVDNQLHIVTPLARWKTLRRQYADPTYSYNPVGPLHGQMQAPGWRVEAQAQPKVAPGARIAPTLKGRGFSTPRGRLGESLTVQ